MKKIIVLLSLPFLLTSCDLDPIQVEAQLRKDTVTIPETVQTLPNGDTVTIPSQTLEKVSTNYVYKVNPAWETTINTAKSINQIANPTPTAPIVNLALGAVTLILGAIVRAKNKTLSGKEAVLETLITGIEQANDPRVKEAIKALSRKNGTELQTHAEVKKHT